MQKSVTALPTGNLGCLYSAHLRNPRWSRLDLAHSANLVRGVAGDADVVASLERELDVADLEELGAALLGVLAGGLQDLVDEVVCYLED
jgi:hypothetical protein